MVGPPYESRSLSKWLGSLGQFGEPSHEYFIAEAAKELGCSFMELEAHPERERLMAVAFTLSIGRADGEHAMQCNPIFIQKQRERQKQIEKAQNKGK